MLQNSGVRSAAVTAAVHICSCILPPNLKAIGRSAETAGVSVGSKQFEKLNSERWSRAKFRISDEKISVSSVLCGFISLYTKHTLALHGCLQIVPTQRRFAGVKKDFDVFSKQIAVLKDLQFLLACCRRLCLKKNKHPEVDGRLRKAIKHCSQILGMRTSEMTVPWKNLFSLLLD